MKIRREVFPFLVPVLACGVFLVIVLLIIGLKNVAFIVAGIALILSSILIAFFRDPERQPPREENAVVAGADGVVMAVCEEDEGRYLKTRSVRVSIFLSLWDVHVTRYPVSGTVREVGYLPGKTVPAFKTDSSMVNRRSTIFIKNERTACLVNQIVGVVARRAVHWAETGQQVERGCRMGMMKFGSRLDILFPASDVTVSVQRGERVRAGETVIARLNGAIS